MKKNIKIGFFLICWSLQIVAGGNKALKPFVWVIGQLGKVGRSEFPSEYTMHLEKHPRKYSEDDERLVTKADGVIVHHDSITVKFVYGVDDTILYMNKIYAIAQQNDEIQFSASGSNQHEL